MAHLVLVMTPCAAPLTALVHSPGSLVLQKQEPGLISKSSSWLPMPLIPIGQLLSLPRRQVPCHLHHLHRLHHQAHRQTHALVVLWLPVKPPAQCSQGLPSMFALEYVAMIAPPPQQRLPQRHLRQLPRRHLRLGIVQVDL